jgi:hypothetical protein
MVANTASVTWQQNGIRVRVYASDGVTVTERCWDGSGWYTGAFKQTGQAVSATAQNGPIIRVYCVNAGVTTEYCWDNNGPWYKGAYTP